MTHHPQHDRCVLTRHDVQSIKDLVFVVGGNAESGAQKAIFEILANNMRSSRSHSTAPSSEQEIREKVLDEFQKWFADECNKVRPYKQIFTENEISEKIAELRQQER